MYLLWIEFYFDQVKMHHVIYARGKKGIWILSFPHSHVSIVLKILAVNSLNLFVSYELLLYGMDLSTIGFEKERWLNDKNWKGFIHEKRDTEFGGKKELLRCS